MFGYYGSKSRVVKYYPKPIYDKIIEPFAGSAKYSLLHFEKDVLLIDKYDKIIKVWKWLQKCNPKDILGLPKLTKGLRLSELDLSEDERLFLGFGSGSGAFEPRDLVSPLAAHTFKTSPNFYKNIANNLYKIKHWTIQEGSYLDIPNQNATWFIDAPYQFGGEHYKFGTNFLKFDELKRFCLSREGQTIICENTKADWLPFAPLRKMQGIKHITTEAIWTNLPSSYNSKQLVLA